MMQIRYSIQVTILAFKSSLNITCTFVLKKYPQHIRTGSKCLYFAFTHFAFTKHKFLLGLHYYYIINRSKIRNINPVDLSSHFPLDILFLS